MEFPSVPTLFDISLRNSCRILLKPEPNPASNQELQEAQEHEYLLKLLRTGAFSGVAEKIQEHLVKFYSRSLSNGCLQAVCPPHLRELSLKGCVSLTWAGVKQALSSLHSLRSLDLSQCDQLISDDLDISDLHLATTLTSLKLEECPSLTDRVVQNFLRSVPSLQHLNVSGCDRLTDLVFLLNEELQLSREAHGKIKQNYECHLTSVDLSGCCGISSTAVRHLVTLTGPTLKSVNLARCGGVDCVALLFLCGYGLLSTVPIILSGKDERDNPKDISILKKNEKEIYEMQAKIAQMENTREALNTGNNTDVPRVVLENEADICEVLKGFSSDVICIEEIESQDRDKIVIAQDFSEKKYMKSKSLERVSGDEVKHFSQEPTSDAKICANDGGKCSIFQGCVLKDCFEPGLNAADFYPKSEVMLANRQAVELDTPQLAGEDRERISSRASSLKLSAPNKCESENRKGSGRPNSIGYIDQCLTKLQNPRADVNSFSTEVSFLRKKSSEIPSSYSDSDITCKLDFKTGFQRTPLDEFFCQTKVNVESADADNENVVFATKAKIDSDLKSCTSDVSRIEENENKNFDGFAVAKSNVGHILVSNSDLETFALDESSCMSPNLVVKKDCDDKLQSNTAELHTLGNVSQFTRDKDSSVKCDVHGEREENVLLDFPVSCAASQMEEGVQMERSSTRVEASQHLFNTTTTNVVAEMDYAHLSEVKDLGELSETNNSEKNCALTMELERTKCSKKELLQKRGNTCDNYVDATNDVEDCLGSHLEHSDRYHLKKDNEIETGGFPCRQMYSSDLISLDIEFIKFRNTDPGLVKTCLETFFKHNKNLVKLKISWEELTNEMVSFIATQAEHLEEASLVNCDQVTNSGVDDLGRHCRKISNLDLKGVCFITDSALWPCLVNARLRHLCLSECGIADITLKWIAENLSDTLQSLHLAWCDEITESGLAAMLSRTFFCLKSLSLRQGPVSNQILLLLSERCPSLTDLVLSSVRFDLEDEAMVHLAKKLRHLKAVDISWNSGLTDLSIDAFLTYCPELESAIFEGIKRISSEPLLKLIADDGSWVKRQSTLRNIQREKRQQQQWGMKLAAVEEMEEIRLPHRSTVFAPSLTHLDLTYCDLINDFHLAEISAVGRGSLEIIDYHGESVTPSWIRFSPVPVT